MCDSISLTEVCPLQESENEEDHLLDVGDDDVEDEQEHEPGPELVVPEEPIKKPLPTPTPQKDTERQLSKKELKKKELAELDAVLAELGISNTGTNGPVGTQGKHLTIWIGLIDHTYQLVVGWVACK